MSTIVIAAARTIPVSRWMWLLLALTLATLYAVTFDGGLISSTVAKSQSYLHELFHDGRHLLGVPCH